jgi:hypothetical protein
VVQERNWPSTNAAEMNDSCESPGNYEKLTDNQAMLFSRVEGRVAESAQCRQPAREQHKFDCLANLWSDQAGRQRRAPVCRAYYILGFWSEKCGGPVNLLHHKRPTSILFGALI